MVKKTKETHYVSSQTQDLHGLIIMEAIFIGEYEDEE